MTFDMLNGQRLVVIGPLFNLIAQKQQLDRCKEACNCEVASLVVMAIWSIFKCK